HRFHGFSRLQGRLANLSPFLTPASVAAASPQALFFSNSLTSNDIHFPMVATLSAYQDVNERLALLGSVVYTGWKSLRILELKRVAAYAPGLGQLLINSPSTLDYRNVWRYSLGANYYLCETWMLRLGGGYDQTPTRNRFRDIRIPDTSRWAA